MSESASEKRQRRRRRRSASAFAAVALLGLSALAFAAWTSLGQTATAGTSSAPASTTTATSAPPTSTATVSPLPVGPAALQPSSPSQVAAWDAGSAGAALTAVTAHLGAALMAHDTRQFAQMKRACASLASDVTAAGAQSAIPDPAMQSMYSKALASLATGAANCQAAVSSHLVGDEDLVTKTDSSLLATAMSQLVSGTRDLYIATYKIKGLKRA